MNNAANIHIYLLDIQLFAKKIAQTAPLVLSKT
jgi:hypothetical protein